MAGARPAVIGAALVAIGAMVIGNVFGLLSGYRGGFVDSVVMRTADFMYALPGLLVAIVVIGVLGGGYMVAVILLAVLFAPYDARLVRGATLEQRSLAYVEAAETAGVGPWRVVFFHIWPNLLPIVVANTFLTFSYAIVALASLSYLGLGVGPETADWGRMISDGRLYLFDNAAFALAPGAMIVLTAASVGLVGDWMHERLADRGRAR
jgi:peptide/nickel transport system permease protein